MKILFINNDGGGFADRIDIPDGLTVAQLFAERLPHGQSQDYLIRVNRQPSAADTVLQEHDRVSITPTKIEGAESPSSPKNSEGVPCERALPINNRIRSPFC